MITIGNIKSAQSAKRAGGRIGAARAAREAPAMSSREHYLLGSLEGGRGQ
jgi:hypothetical protein